MRRAFTLIEILIGLGVMLVLITAAGSGLSNANKRQSLDQVTQNVRQAFLQAKSYAQAGKKDCTVCAGATPPYSCGASASEPSLTGWQVIVNSNNYVIEGWCGATRFYQRQYDLPGFTLVPSGSVIFKPVGQGTNLAAPMDIAIYRAGLSEGERFRVETSGELSGVTVTMSTPTLAPTATRTPTPGATVTPTRTPTPSPTPSGSTTLTRQVGTSSDDVNEDGATFSTSGSTVWIGTNGSTVSSYTGLRFNNVTVPAGATVSTAHLEVYSSAGQWISIAFDISGEANGNCATFSSGSKPSQRGLTVQKVSHSSDVEWLAGTWYSLNEMASVVGEIVGRGDWVSGNSLCVIMKGTGSAFGDKSATSYDGSGTNASKLVVTYSGGGPAATATPTRTPTPTGVATFPATAIFDNFNRTDSSTLGTSWTSWWQSVSYKIVTNQAVDGVTSGSWSGNYYNTTTFGPNVEAYMTVVNIGSGQFEIAGRLTGDQANPNGYMVSIASGTWIIQKVTGGSGTTIGASFSQPVGNGASIGIKITGTATTSISAMYKASGGSWVTLATRTDSTSPYITAGYVAWDSVGTGSNTPTFDDFGGGTTP